MAPTETVRVPQLAGRTVAEARAICQGLGLQLRVPGPPSAALESRRIRRVDPQRTTDQRSVGEPITIGGTVGVILISP